MSTRPTHRQIADLQADQPAWPEGAPDSRWTDEALRAYILAQESDIAALEPADAPLDWNGLSTPELDELSAAKTPEAVARIEARIRQRIASRQEQLQQMRQRKVKVTK
jgi:hypothetical protein